MKFFRLFFLLTLYPALLSAQPILTYYVSDTGSDANPGTAAQPFRTVQKCVSRFRDTAQVICNCAGTFNEEISITAGGPSVERRSRIIAWDTDGDGELGDETFILDGEGTRNETIKATTGARPDNIEIAWATFRNYDPDGGCNVDDDGELHFIKIVCWGDGGCADWWIHNNVFEKMGGACNVESHYIAIQPSDAPNLIVENNRFDSIGGFIMRYVGGTGIRFRNNLVIVTGTGIKAWDDPDSIEIVGNVFACDGNGINRPGDTRCGGQAAVSLSNNVRWSQIRDNTFLDCVTPINIATDDRFGTKNNGPHLVEGNRIYQSGKVCNLYAPAIEVSDVSDTTIYGDSIHVFDLTIRNNVIAWTDSTKTSLGTAFLFSAGHPFPFVSNYRIYNNTIHSYGRGILISAAAKSGVRYPHQLNGLVVRNNVFSDIRDEYITLAGTVATWPDSGRELNWDSDYNLFSGRERITWAGIRYNTLPQWVAAKGEDVNSRVSSPLFAAEAVPSRPVYALAAGDTVARNRGNTIPEVATDFSGFVRPMGGAWDIGAHEVRDMRIQYASASAGSDANPGTADMPFRTLQHALSAWNGIDQFELRGAGRFSEELVLRRGGLSADSLNQVLPWDTDRDGSVADETFILDGANTWNIALQTDSSAAPDYVRISGLEFRNYGASEGDGTQEVRFLKLKGSSADSLVGWRVEGNTFHNLGAGRAGTKNPGAIRGDWVNDLRIEGNHFDSISGAVLRGEFGKSVVFASNTVRLVGNGVVLNGDIDSLSVTNNVFIGDGNGAVSSGERCKEQFAVDVVNGVRYGTVRENVIVGTSGGIRFGVDSEGRRNNAHHIVERNILYMNDNGCDPEPSGVQVVDIGDTTASGTRVYVEDILIRNNVLAYNGDARMRGGAIELAAGHSFPFGNEIRIYNNTIHGFAHGILTRHGEGESYLYRLNGVKVKNNIFSGMGDAYFTFRNGALADSLPSGWESDYNAFGTIGQVGSGGRKALSAWRDKTGQDVHSVLCQVDFEAGDTLYHLADIDLCARERGIALSEVTDDIDGDERPSGNAPDIGADEYVAGVLGRVAVQERDGSGASGGGAILSGLRLYPNPASETSVLEFFLSGPEQVTLRVWNVTGFPADGVEHVLPLARGWHRVELEPAGLPNGVYLAAITAGTIEYTARLVVTH